MGLVEVWRLPAGADLRAFLAERLGVAVDEVTIERDRRGKPQLAGGGLEFNLSHTEGLTAIAIADRPVGVDVERVRPRRRLDGDGDLRRFYADWTRREALVKGTGEGLPALIAGAPEPEGWTARPLDLADGYAGAVAAPGEWDLAVRR